MIIGCFRRLIWILNEINLSQMPITVERYCRALRGVTVAASAPLSGTSSTLLFGGSCVVVAPSAFARRAKTGSPPPPSALSAAAA